MFIITYKSDLCLLDYCDINTYYLLGKRFASFSVYMSLIRLSTLWAYQTPKPKYINAAEEYV